MKHFACLSLVLLISAASFAADAPIAIVAPPENPELAPKKIGKMTSVIKLRNVRPTLIVQWLDPKNHQPFAMDCGGIRTTANPFPKTKSVFDLPKGLDSLVALESQNSLLARGTNQAIEKLQQLIDLVDQPRQELDLEVALYITDAETIKKLKHPDIDNVFFFDREKKVLAEVIAQEQTQILKTEKLRAVNNLAICSETKFPMNDALKLITFQVRLAPTINGDGTITVLAQPALEQTTIVENQETPTISTSMIQTIFIVRDNDSVALVDASEKENSLNWFCVITPHLVKDNAVSPQK